MPPGALRASFSCEYALWLRWLVGIQKKLGGGGFNYFLMFIPIPGEDSHIDYDFSNGLKRPTRKSIGKEMGEF